MIERIFSHFDIAQICLLSFLKAVSKLLIFIGSRLYFSATIEFSFSLFFFLMKITMQIYSTIPNWSWKWNGASIWKKFCSNKFLYVFYMYRVEANFFQNRLKSNLDRKKFAHSPIQFLQTAQEIDRLGHILYSFHRFDLKRFVSRLQTLIDLLQPEQTWKGRDEIYSDRFENSLWPCARLVITHYTIRVFRKLCAHDCASHRPLFIGRRSVWPAVHTPNVSQWLHRNRL